MIYRNAAQRTPILPRSLTNPVGGDWVFRKAYKAIDERFKAIRQRVLAAFRMIPHYKVNVTEEEIGQYVYGMTAAQISQLSMALQDTLDYYLANPDKQQFFMADIVEDAERTGTVAAQANLAHLSSTYAAARPIESIIISQPYITRVAAAVSQSYDGWKSLSATAKADLSGVIGRAIAQGLNPRTVESQIIERLDVSRSKARSLAQTEITGALREARWAETDAANDALDLDIRILWTSALLPTTRQTHAARHGKVYTTEQVRAFYSENGNRYNCHCGNTECLVDESGKPILSKQAQSSMAKEKANWVAENK